MTIDEIRAEHKRIVERRKSLNKEMRILLKEWAVLKAKCDHKNKYRTSIVGDSGDHCPDCGYGT